MINPASFTAESKTKQFDILVILVPHRNLFEKLIWRLLARAFALETARPALGVFSVDKHCALPSGHPFAEPGNGDGTRRLLELEQRVFGLKVRVFRRVVHAGLPLARFDAAAELRKHLVLEQAVVAACSALTLEDARQHVGNEDNVFAIDSEHWHAEQLGGKSGQVGGNKRDASDGRDGVAVVVVVVMRDLRRSRNRTAVVAVAVAGGG